MMPKGVAAKECAERRTFLRPVGADMVRMCLFTLKRMPLKRLKTIKTRKRARHASFRWKEYIINIFIIHHLFVCLSVLFVCQMTNMTNMANARFDRNQLTQTDG
jgi:hypothetical protein